MFSIGDRVTFIDEAINGVVIAISGEMVTLEDESGFNIECNKSDLIKRSDNFEDEMSKYIDDKTFDRIMNEKRSDKRKIVSEKIDRKQEHLIEVDLHIERILRNYKHMSAGDILDYQIHRAKYKLEESLRSNKRGIIFIHGHGDGILKAELDTLLRRYKVQFYDADYAKYGGGATEVIFKDQNIL